jgi:hypothetical protein
MTPIHPGELGKKRQLGICQQRVAQDQHPTSALTGAQVTHFKHGLI